ncbi:hypothetical protein HY630_02385 [Candidatus Uhrbacteria bacterium]|nr:hypothetical protein [Candidatus Uhrbacteria bacterium]
MQNSLNLAMRAARAGGDVLREFRLTRTPLGERRKGNNSPVTDADIAASRAVHSILSEGDPGGFVLDEEEEDAHDVARPDAFWVIDPLDGTRFFLDGSDAFCTMVGLIKDGTPRLGAVYFPMQDVLFFGGDNLGAWRQTEGQEARQLLPRDVPDLHRARMSGPSKPDVQALYTRIATALGIASSVTHEPAGGMYAALLTGEADLALTRPVSNCSVWDIAAGHAMLLALGGTIVDLSGNPIDYRHDCRLSNGSIAVVDRRLLGSILERLPARHELVVDP